MKQQVLTKKGLFDWDTLTVKFGGEKSKPENIFTAQAIVVPAYTETVRERESLGGGWYGGMETNIYTRDKTFVIVRDGNVIGVMYQPYSSRHNIKTILSEITDNTPKPVLDFIKLIQSKQQGR